MRQTTITNATALGVSVNLESLTDSSNDVYLKCDGGYFRGSVVSGLRKERTTVDIEGLLVDPDNTSGPMDSLSVLSSLAQDDEKTTLTVKTLDGNTVVFGEGKITNISLEGASQVNEAIYNLSFETESTSLSQGEGKNEYLLLDPANYKSIDESFSYSRNLEDDSWDVSHDLRVVPNNKGDLTTKKQEAINNDISPVYTLAGPGAVGKDGLQGLSTVQVAQSYIQEAMEGSNSPPFPLSDSVLADVLAESCDAASYSDDCTYRLDYSYSTSVDLLCGGVSTNKTTNITKSGAVDGYKHTYDIDFDRNEEGVINVTLNGNIEATKQDENKSYYDYAEAGYATERGKASARIEAAFEEFKSPNDDDLTDGFTSSTKTITNQSYEGKLTYSLERSNSSSQSESTEVSQRTSTDQSYQTFCGGSRRLVTTITQQASVQGLCGANITPEGAYPKFNGTQTKFNTLIGAAGSEIEALYNGDFEDQFRLISTKTSANKYKGTQSYTITYSDGPTQNDGQSFQNADANGCYSWKVDSRTIPATERYAESKALDGKTYLEKKGTNLGEKRVTVQMRGGTGDSCGDPFSAMLTKAGEIVNSNNEGACFLKGATWSYSAEQATPATLNLNATFIQE